MKADERGELVLIYNGLKIAQRTPPGAGKAAGWIPLEPGYNVTMSGDDIVIEHKGVRVH